MLIGQVADGVMTPVVGYLSDKYNFKIGRRKFWYILGFIIEAVCFLMIYRNCLICELFNDYSFNMKMFYYSLFPAFFNIGWAMVEVSHMSLGPMLTCSRSRRDRLNNIRFTFSYISQFIVLMIAFFYFWKIKNPLNEFTDLSYTICALGICTSLYFIYMIDEPFLTWQCI